MLFAVPMIWREPKDHNQDCYFCLANVKGFSKKHRMKISYPNLDSARRPVPHDNFMPAPIPPKNGLDTLADKVGEDYDEENIPAPKDSTDSEYDPEESLKPILFSQKCLNNLIRDLALSKQKAELLASRLQETTCFMQMLWLPIRESVTWTFRQFQSGWTAVLLS